MKRSKRRGVPDIYQIVKWPEDILLRPAKSFSRFAHAEDLKDFLHEATLRSGGLAVAANQIGVNASAFFMRVGNKNTFMINPRIIDQSIEKVTVDEGCLSIPGVVWHVSRPKEVFVEAFDSNGEKFEYEASGLEARVIQHEIDHLDGLAIPDFLPLDDFDLFVKAYYSHLNIPNAYIDFEKIIDATGPIA